ncbi:MAG: M24 family metallopeptidase [Bacillota bacterium]
MRDRIQAVRSLLKEHELDGLLVDSGVNRFYLTGFTGTAGRVLFTPDHSYFITDFRYREQAEQQTEGYQILEINKEKEARIGQVLADEGVSRLGFEASSVTVTLLENYREHFPDIELEATKDLIEGLRLLKQQQEVARIEEAIDIAEKGFKHILEYIEPGMTEREIGLELEYFMKKAGGTANAFDFIVASGYRSSLPHGVASDKRVRQGELITIDFGTVSQGYCSDMTRTFVLGQATGRQREIYELVLEAHLKVIEEIKPGMSGREADALARDLIKEAGYGDNFGHGLGHGLGIEVHEQPRLSYTSETTLEPGMVVTDEPGIYLPDWGGVRIEDDLLITEDGCRVLNSLDKEFFEL